MREICEHVPAGFGCTADVQFHRNYPPTINHDREVTFLRDVMREVAGPDRTLEMEPAMTAEDFSFFLEKKPGAYFMIGNGDGEGSCMVHNPGYDFNDASLPVGAAYWALLAERFLVE